MDDRSWRDILKAQTALNERFSVSRLSGRILPIERFLYEIEGSSIGSTEDSSIDSRSRKRVDALAKLLHQPKELVFRIPRCRG